MTADGGVDPDSLGRATWTFLHTLAASQPQKISTGEQKRLNQFMNDFSILYPCAPCAESFREILRHHPPVTSSGPKFAEWMCHVHNQVNKELNKTQFDCSRVGERWGVCEHCADHKDQLNEFKSLMSRFKTR